MRHLHRLTDSKAMLLAWRDTARWDGPGAPRLPHRRVRLPTSEKVAVAIAVTFAEEAFAPDGNYTEVTGANAADLIWRDIAAVVAPDDPPPGGQRR